MKLSFVAIAGAAFLLSAAHAATIELSDGRRLHAEVVGQNDVAYVLKMFGGEVQIPRSMVVEIRPEDDRAEIVKPGSIQVLPSTDGSAVVFGSAWPAKLREREADCGPINVSREADEQADQVELPLPADPVALTNLQDALNSLRSNDATAVAAARQVFSQYGDEGLGVLARHGLYHESPTVRTASAFLLGSLGGEKVLGVLIQAFYAAAHPTIQPYQVNFVQELTSQISRLTGVNFTFYPRQGNEAPLIARQMVTWWRNNFAKLPQQLGEPALDPGDPDYMTKLWSIRNLPMERRQFVGFNLPPDFVPPAEPQTQAEADFAATIPIIPRDLSLERRSSWSSTPAADRALETQYTPGDRRRDQYLDRMRNEMQRGIPGRGLQ